MSKIYNQYKDTKNWEIIEKSIDDLVEKQIDII